MSIIIPDLTLSQWFFVLATVSFVWTIIMTVKGFLRKKKKPKFKKEYDIIILAPSGAIPYTRGNVEKIRYFGKKYIAIKLTDGTWISYEGFSFIVTRYKIKLDESPIL
jgi:hypothetical protein